MNDIAYTKNRTISIPDIEITQDDSTYVYHPCRGYSATMAVENIDGEIIGWIDSRTLGFNYVEDYMKHHKMELN